MRAAARISASLAGVSLCRHRNIEFRLLAGNVEDPFMVQAMDVDDAVRRHLKALGLQAFLQIRLGVLRRPLGKILEPATEKVHHQGAGRFDAAVFVHGADQRFHRIPQDGSPVPRAGTQLPRAQKEVPAEVDPLCHCHERISFDEGRPQQRERIFPVILPGPMQVLSDDVTEHRIAQKLQPLVVLR